METVLRTHRIGLEWRSRGSLPRPACLPFKFLLRHYSIRTQEQGERKIFDGLKRLNRYDSEVRGWHVQYDELSKRRSFVWDPETLLRFDEETFYRDYVVERLSGVGIIR